MIMFSFHFFLSPNFSFPIFYLLFLVNLFCLQRKQWQFCNGIHGGNSATAATFHPFHLFAAPQTCLFRIQREGRVRQKKSVQHRVVCAFGKCPCSVRLRHHVRASQVLTVPKLCSHVVLCLGLTFASFGPIFQLRKLYPCSGALLLGFVLWLAYVKVREARALKPFFSVLHVFSFESCLK